MKRKVMMINLVLPLCMQLSYHGGKKDIPSLLTTRDMTHIP